MENEETWFHVDEEGNIEEVKEFPGLNKYCYFCDFSGVKPHMHHIIRKCDGGDDSKNNLIPLCPNHHEGIHRRTYILIFNPKQKVYYLKNKITGNILPPTEKHFINKKKLPKTLINYSKKLIVEGDLNSKGKVIIKKDDKKRVERG